MGEIETQEILNEAEAGQESGSPSDTPASGEEGAATGAIGAEEPGSPPGGTGEEGTPSLDESGGAGEGVLQFDKDPKWLAARAAEKSLTAILDDGGFESVEELNEALKAGMSLQQLLGDNDAAKLIKDSETLQKYNEYWARADAEKLEAKETPEQTIARLKEENKKVTDASRRSEQDRQSSEDGVRIIAAYDKEVTKVVEAADLSAEHIGIAAMLLGVDNPANKVDVEDVKAVRIMAKAGVDKFKAFVDDVRQQAVDEYAAGKSKLVPSGAPRKKEGEGEGEGEGTPVKGVVPGVSVDEAFAAANKELLEMINAGAAT